MPNVSSAHRRAAPGDGVPKPAPQTDRLANLEAAVVAIQQTLEVQFKRMATIQAELDVLAGEVRATGLKS